MISQTAEYALRAIVQLSLAPDDAQTAQQIATATRTPIHYLAKVLKALARVGLIHSQRGPKGGVTLLKRPEAISVYEIVQAVDPMKRIVTCPLGLEAHGIRLCPLHRKLDDAFRVIETSFRQTSIADILSEPTSSKPLCPFPLTSNPA